MKKFLIAGSSLAAVAAAGSAGAVDVTLGGSISMEMDFGVGKGSSGFAFDPSSASQTVKLSLAAAGTTDGGLKYGGSFSLSTADELKLDLYGAAGAKKLVKLVNSEVDAGIKGAAYNISGGQKIKDVDIVSVKINSAWQDAGGDVTGYAIDIESLADADAVCKVAGRAQNAMQINQTEIINATPDGKAFFAAGVPAAAGGYLPAGLITGAAAANFELTALNSAGNATIQGHGIAGNDADLDDGDAKFNLGVAADTDSIVAGAKVYAGPFMSVKLASSTTKMVIGAVCVTGDAEASSTKAFLDVSSRVMQASDASVYIEGGFGKLTLSTSDYAGKVSAIGKAGDQAKVSNSGFTLSGESLGFMGAELYGAVSLGTISDNARPNWMLGTTAELMGASVAFEIEDETGTTKMIDNWDFGGTYAMGDMNVGFAVDSNKDWGLSADMSLAGISLGTTAYYYSADNEKSGLIIDVTAKTSFNGLGVEIGVDQEMDYDIGLSYAMGVGNMSLTAGYSSEDKGGKIGAKLSF